VARKITRYLFEIMIMIVAKVLMSFEPFNQGTDKLREDTETDSQNTDVASKEKKIYN
jgi:hypothetical protein